MITVRQCPSTATYHTSLACANSLLAYHAADYNVNVTPPADTNRKEFICPVFDLEAFDITIEGSVKHRDSEMTQMSC